MGQAILYCFRCSIQLREAHFEQRKAFRIDSWVCCAACAPEAIRSLPPDRAQLLQKLIAGPEKKAAPAAPKRDSTPRIPAPLPPPASFATKGILIGVAAVAVLGIVLAVA